MLNTVVGFAMTLFLTAIAQSENPTWGDVFEKFRELPLINWLWIPGSLAIAAILGIAAFGDQLSGFLSLFGIESPFRRATPSEQTLKTSRNQLLQILKKENEMRMANSLHELVKLDRYMEDQRQQVGKPKVERVPEDPPDIRESRFQIFVNRVLLQKKSTKLPLSLKRTQKIIEVFDRPDIQGRLLILGEPGSGKTTELLHLAQDLTTRSCEAAHSPIPLILELSAWNGEKIDGWVVRQIRKQYNIREYITHHWLEGKQLLLLLDGLDELGLEKQKQCIEGINQFLEKSYPPGLVVCCRREEYEAGQIELDELNGAVYLEALKEDQMQTYFAQLNRRSLWDHVRTSPVLLELARKPLFLFMLVIAHQGQPIRNEQELFDAYIEKQLHDPVNQGIYRSEKGPNISQTRHCLVWLARQLESRLETEFLIEGLQPSYLQSNKQRIFYRLILGLIFGLIFGLINGLFGGLVSEMSGGLIFGLWWGVLFGCLGGLYDGLITPVKLTWSLRRGLAVGLISGLLVVGLFGVLVVGLFDELRAGLFVVLVLGLMSGLVGGLIGGVIGGLIEEKVIPNQGIWNSMQSVLKLVLISGLNVGLISGLSFGLIVGVFVGLDAIIKHLILRIFLTKDGYMPWNYARFLEHAVKHRFIQRTGGRYRFVHDLLRKHFAAMPLE